MNKNDAYTLLCGDPQAALTHALPALPPFSEQTLSFLADLSAALLKDKTAKAYPDVITFAFFCRKSHLLQLQREYEGFLRDRLGRGLVFHIAPSNVPVNFAYSLVTALLAGNASIVKASSQNFPQTEIICAAINSLFSGSHAQLASYACVITYPRENQALTEAFSAACDARMIWGGDETVRRVREAPLPPFAFDVTFADRYSLLCLTPKAVLDLDSAQLTVMAQGFYNDSFLSDQNACTAPRLIYWLCADDKAETQAAQARFWQAVHDYAAPRYPIEPVIAVDKLTALYRAAVALSGAKRVPMPDNLIARIRVDALSEAMLDFRCAGGCFVEYESDSLDALAAIARRKVQTVSYLGIQPELLRDFVLSQGLRGIDRIVPIGKTMDFSLTWDGYDLIRTLSRCIQIPEVLL